MAAPTASLLLAVAALPAYAADIADSNALAIVQKHCVVCHAVKPTHESFQEAPKNITLETVAEIKRHAAAVYAQTIKTRAMPLGNETGMTDDERERLGRWLKDNQ